MSLMRKSVRGFVAQQLEIREALLSLGGDNSRFSSINFNGLDLPKGAFYSAAVSKQAVIRMYSGVDIHTGTFPEYPDEVSGVNLAKQFVLEGGTGYDFNFPEIKAKGKNLGRKETEFNAMDQKSGFARSGGTGWKSGEALFKGAYGNSHFRAHPHKGYGIVPMPGILDANIRTVSDYGSLRIAKVNFVCHNLPQLEVLEMLYMRPGYPILVEWGWLPYVDNTTGKLETTLPYFTDFWDSNSKLFDMHTNVIKNKIKYSANYDAVLGFCKNFEYTARHDGGFDFYTEVMGYGEIMQGLPGRSEAPPTGYYDDELKGKDGIAGVYIPESNTDGATKSGKTRIKLERSMVPGWVLGSEDASGNLDNFAWIISALAYYTRPVTHTMGPDDLPHEIEKQAYKKATGWDGTTVSRPTNSFEKAADKAIKLLTNIAPNVSYKQAARDIADHYCVNGSFFNHNIFDFEKSNKNPPGSQEALRLRKDQENTDFTKIHPDNGGKIQFAFTDTIYLRWDFLVEILNKFVINQHTDSKDSSPLARYTVFTPEATYWDVPTDFKYDRWDREASDNAFLNSGEITTVYEENIDHPLQGERRWDFGSYIEMSGPPMLKPELEKDFLEIAKESGVETYIRNTTHKKTSAIKTNWFSTSFDPTICIFPGQTIASHGLTTGGADQEGGKPIPKHQYQQSGWDPVVSNTNTYKNKYGQTHNGNSNVTHFNKEKKKIPRGNYEGRHIHHDSHSREHYLGMSDKYIGLIYIEYKWLIELWKKEHKKKDFTYFKFLSLMWKKIGEDACCGNHEFILHTDESQSNIRVVDLKQDPSMAPPSNMYSFKVQDKDSIVRDYTFSSSIPDSISATIAIAAQSPDSMNEDTTTLSAFSNNLSSRFSSFTGQKSDKIETYKDLVLKYIEHSSKAWQYWYWIYAGFWQYIHKKQITATKESVKSAIKALHMLNNIDPQWRNTGPDANNNIVCDKVKGSPGEIDENMDPYWDLFGSTKFNGYCTFVNKDWEDHGAPSFNVQSLNVQNTDLIPVNMSLTMDGISGIRIGDVVKINNPKAFPRLPKAYQRDDVYWVVFGDEHKVTSGQDWEQELTLQLTLMGDLEYGFKKGSTSSHAAASNNTAAIASINTAKEDALGNPRTTKPVRQPAGWINPVAAVGLGIDGSSAFDFGERVLRSGPNFHNGVDIQRWDGQKGVFMPKKATIIKIGYNGVCGNQLKFKFDSVGTDEPTYGQFCHLDSYNTKKDGTALAVDDTVEQGERVGIVGKTGCGSCGTHLHYALNTTEDFATHEETTGIDPCYFLDDTVNNVPTGVAKGNYYDLAGLEREIALYLTYVTSEGMLTAPEHQRVDAIKSKIHFLKTNFNISESLLGTAITEFQTTGTLLEANYQNFGSGVEGIMKQ